MSEAMNYASVLCFANNKGGVGKTTTVATLGQAWARIGKKVLLVDLDSQANLTTILNQPIPSSNAGSIRDAMIDPGSSWPIPIEPNLDLWPANLRLGQIEMDLAGSDSREFRLLDAIDTVRDNYNLILIDCPPTLGLLTYNALVASDYLVLTATADELSYAGVGMVAELASRIRQKPRMNPNLRILGLIITKYKASQTVNKNYYKQIKEDVADVFIDVPIRERSGMVKATSFHKSIFDFEPGNDAAKDYLAVADILLKRIEERSKNL